MKKGLLVYLMCLVLLFTTVLAIGCQDIQPTAIAITSQGSVTEIEAGKTLQLTAVVTPDKASQEVTWTTSNADVATVDANGLVTAVAQGNVTITATSKVNADVSKTFALVINPQTGGGTGSDEKVPTEIRLQTSGSVKEVLIGNVLKVVATVRPTGVSQEVIWASSDDKIATVDQEGNVTGVAEGEVTITVTSKEVASVTNSIKITVKAADSTYEDMDFTSHSDYMVIANNTKIKVKGVVTFILPENDGKVSYYIQNGTGGFYIYQQDATNYPVELGKVYAVGGQKKNYNGTQEVVSIEYCQLLNEEMTAASTNLDDKDPSSKDEMSVYHGGIVTGTATVTAAPSIAAKAYSVNVNINNKSTTLRIDPANVTADEFAKINAKLTDVIAGVEIEFRGIMSAFGYGNVKNQIAIMSSDDLIIKEATPQQKVDVVKDSLVVKAFVGKDSNSIILATTSTAFEDVTISWSSDNTDIIANNGTVVHPEQDTTVTLTATVTHKTDTTATATATFKVNVAGLNFNGDVLVSLDFEDEKIAEAGKSQYGISNFKGGYTQKPQGEQTDKEANTVTIGSNQWLLWNTLIAKDGSEHVDGEFGARMQANSNPDSTGRLEILTAGEYNYIQFDAAVYGSNQLGICLRIEYKLESGDWTALDFIVSVDSYALTTYRFQLPEGIKTVAITVVPDSGQRVNIDNIELGK